MGFLPILQILHQQNARMLGLVLLYFVGRYFNRLAKEYDKNGTLYAILGIVTYFGSQFLIGVILGVVLITSEGNLGILEDNRFVIDLLSIPVGLLAAWGLHAYLKKKWSTEMMPVDETILDDDIYLKE
jgi:hypothetical protein